MRVEQFQWYVDSRRLEDATPGPLNTPQHNLRLAVLLRVDSTNFKNCSVIVGGQYQSEVWNYLAGRWDLTPNIKFKYCSVIAHGKESKGGLRLKSFLCKITSSLENQRTSTQGINTIETSWKIAFNQFWKHNCILLGMESVNQRVEAWELLPAIVGLLNQLEDWC